MGNREYVITSKEEPYYKVGDIYSMYIGKGFFIDTIVKDIRLSNISSVYVIKLKVLKDSKKYHKEL